MSSAIFERQIAQFLARIAAVERNEEALAERVRNARGRSEAVTESTDRLQGAFPDVLIADPADGLWTLWPIDPVLRGQWEARRAVVVEREVPAFSRAAQAAKADAADADSRRDRLGSRLETARRADVRAVRTEPPISSGNESRNRRCVLRWFAPARPSARPPERTTVGLDGLAKRIAELASAGHKAAQQQSDFGACAAEIQRLRRRLDALDLSSTD